MEQKDKNRLKRAMMPTKTASVIAGILDNNAFLRNTVGSRDFGPETADASRPIQPVTLYEARVDIDRVLSVPLDWHEDPEILYFKKGHFRLMLDMKEYDIRGEQFAFINAGSLHRIESIPDGPGLEYSLRFDFRPLCTAVSDNVTKQIMEPLSAGKLRFRDLIGVSDLPYLNFFSAFKPLMSRFAAMEPVTSSQECSRKVIFTDPADELFVRGDLFTFLGYMYLHQTLCERELTVEDRQVRVIKEAIRYIRKNYAGKIYVHDLSNLTGLNEQYFIRFFGNVVGVPPLEYINHYRVSRARELLEHSEEHISEIAEQCGFHNIGNFINIFSQDTGLTPHKYRRTFGERKALQKTKTGGRK